MLPLSNLTMYYTWKKKLKSDAKKKKKKKFKISASTWNEKFD